MLDIKQIRDNPQAVEKALQKKDPNLSLDTILELDQKVRQIQLELEEFKNQRNQLTKQIGHFKQQRKDVSQILSQAEPLHAKIKDKDHMLADLSETLLHHLAQLPNLPAEDVKDSLDPKDNVCLSTHKNKPSFSFKPKNHLELSDILGLFDFKRGAKIAGTGWPLYRGQGARLEWALIRFMIDIHLANGFELWFPPLVGNTSTLFGAAQLPKFKEQLYQIETDSLFLIPTSEAVLNAIHFDEILKQEKLPLKYVSYTPCFRREAGAAGAQERGLIRTHQFNKVEMFCLTTPTDSNAIYHEMVKSAQTILDQLDLHYRTMLLCSGDMSFASAKTIDLEVYLPGQNRYYEVSSISNCTDFQARRSRIRFKKEGEKNQFVHTLNGSGLATSRLMVALLENNQREDGLIALPQVLHPYMGQTHLTPSSG